MYHYRFGTTTKGLKKVLLSLMALPLPPPPPTVNGLAIGGGTFLRLPLTNRYLL